MTSPRYPLYEAHSDLWPLVAPLESFEDEMMTWVAVAQETLPGGHPADVLDLGSGGGHHLYHLVENWGAPLRGVAVDLEQAMLARVSHLLPEVETLVADMTQVQLERRFPLVCVHDSFCYLTTPRQVDDLFSVIARHLSPKGVALVKIEALADEFEGPYRYLTTFHDDDREVTVTHYEWDPDTSDDWLEVVYVFLERRQTEVTIREERHRLGLFSREFLESAWTRAGLRGEIRELERWDDDRSNPLLVLLPAKVTSPENQNETAS